MIKKMSSALSWQQLVSELPNETVDIDDKGHYDAKKPPNFAAWMQGE
ncbi:AbrB family transcriptional regulator [Apilactobacillus ozensis]|nr:AbrB family transcriptional regulator [Apilactobacillus ozensis]MCK8607250.1 AbrB family transcriptional regulator [Apilactobacillus ozensis]